MAFKNPVKTAKKVTPVASSAQKEIDELAATMLALKRGLKLNPRLDFSVVRVPYEELRAQFGFLQEAANALVTVGGDLDVDDDPHLYTRAENARGAAEEVSEHIDTYIDLVSDMLVGGDAVLKHLIISSAGEGAKAPVKQPKAKPPVKKPPAKAPKQTQADKKFAEQVAAMRAELAEVRAMIAAARAKK